MSRCKSCYSKYWRKNNPDKEKAGRDDWYRRNRESEIAKAKKWNKENANKAKIANAKYTKTHNYYVNRYRTDINFRLRVILRSRLLQSVKTDAKAGSAVRDLGCSITEFKNYIESKFIVGMTWDNMGKWHLDHIEPLLKFDLTDKEQFLKACHYTNIQPLWIEDHIKKTVQDVK